jgi:membrane protease YdiL (CAAX protease family)
VGLYIAEGILSLLTGERPPPQRVAQALAEAQGTGLRVLAVAAVGFVAPFAEEVVFRGVSFRGLRRRLGFFPAAACSAALFSLAHLDLQHGLQLFVVGIVLAWTVERSGSILPGILLHAVINLTSLLVIW